MSCGEIKSEETNGGMRHDLIQSATFRTQGRAFVPFKGLSGCAIEATRKEDKEELPVASGLSLVPPGIRPMEELGASVLGSKASTSKAVIGSSPNVEPTLRVSPPPSQQQGARKQRRCWSPELHRRFVFALQQLGGSQGNLFDIVMLLKLSIHLLACLVLLFRSLTLYASSLWGIFV